MASFDFHAPTGRYHIRFRWGRPYKRSLKLADDRAAARRCEVIDEFLQDLRLGKRAIPEGVDPADFIVAGGLMPEAPKAQPPPPPPEPEAPTLGSLWRLYDGRAAGRPKESTTRETEGYHRAHLTRVLGEGFRLDRLDLAAAQEYARRRAAEEWRGRPIGPATVLKEVATLRVLWNWGVRFGHIDGPFPLRIGDLEFTHTADRAPFQTREQIARTLARGGVAPEEEAALWECLYLTLPEVHSVLDLVRERAAHPFILPMFALAAYAGARRSEICRSRVEDLDFDARMVTIREKKRKRGRDSFRKVDMGGRLAEILKSWLEAHPGGPMTITKDGGPLTVKMASDHFKRTLSRTDWRAIPGFHTLRHSFASILASRGVDEATIDRFMGHSTPEQRERYRHLFPAGLRKAIEALD